MAALPTYTVLKVEIEGLKEWKRDHAQEDDRRHEMQEARIHALELSRVKIMAWVAGAAAGGSVASQFLIWVFTKVG